MELSYIVLLGLAVSIDGFFAGIAYGSKGIKIPLSSLNMIGATTLLYTAIAAFGSQFISTALNPNITTWCGAGILILIGLFTMYRQFSPAQLPSTGTLPLPQQITFSFGKIVVSIIKQPECADIDHSNKLNIIEAFLLGTALGLDNLVATFAAGLTAALPLYAPLVLCIIQTGLVYLGINLAAKVITTPKNHLLIYLPGLVLIGIGVLRLL